MTLRLLVLAPVGLLVAACASYEPSTVAIAEPSPQDWTVKGDIAASADPYVDEQRQEAVFDANFDEADVIAIQVVVENRGDNPMLVRPSDMVLALPDGTKLAPSSVSATVNKVGEDGSVVGAGLAFGVIGVIAAAGAESEARAARTEDYQSKAFEVSAIDQGEMTHGFVFFMPPKGTADFDEATLSVRFSDTAASTSDVIELPLTGLSYEEEEESEPAPRNDSTGS